MSGQKKHKQALMDRQILIDMPFQTYLHDFIAKIQQTNYIENPDKINFQKFKSEKFNGIAFDYTCIYDHFQIFLSQKFIEGSKMNTTSILKYRYAVTDLKNQIDYFRFDFNYREPTTIKPAHINADGETYGCNVNDRHFTYNEDTDINLNKLDIFLGLKIIEFYMDKSINPMKDRGCQYINNLELPH